MLVSNRNIALVYQGQQGSLVKSVLTVESYIKWYDIYVVSPSGRVWELPCSFAADFEQATGLNAWSDHVPRPEFCLWLLEAEPGFEWDSPALDMIRGRWLTEHVD